VGDKHIVLIIRWLTLVAMAVALVGCPKYKPYLPEEFRGPADEPASSQPGLFTGKKGEYVIYGR
tara:strand:- start:345 stop:536 length:192 start_codon:yes stop_codon:yes gene_type:complete